MCRYGMWIWFIRKETQKTEDLQENLLDRHREFKQENHIDGYG